MKSLLFTLAFGLSWAAPLQAQSTVAPDTSSASATATPPHHHARGAGLTKGERRELKSARVAALQADPDLVTEKSQMHKDHKAYRAKLHEAMIKADPNVAPILAKLHAGHHHPATPPAGGATSSNT